MAGSEIDIATEPDPDTEVKVMKTTLTVAAITLLFAGSSFAEVKKADETVAKSDAANLPANTTMAAPSTDGVAALRRHGKAV